MALLHNYASPTEDLIDEGVLFHDISSTIIFDLTLANHIHGLIFFERLSGRIK